MPAAIAPATSASVAGSSLMKSCEDLREAGARIDTVVCAIDREQGGARSLAAAGIELRALLTRDVLERASAQR
jgi:orotate phosphoribosyltransferase